MFVFALACLIAAQDVAAPSTPDTSRFDFGRTAGVGVSEEGRPLAVGPNWMARFDERGATFVPALGDAAPRRQDLGIAAVELRRGDVRIGLRAAEPTSDGRSVSFARALGVTEHFEATLAGLEHSFVVAGPLGSDGDLVVRLALTGEVAAAGSRRTDGSHRFARDGADASQRFAREGGGVTYGRLFGIDASGARCDGDVRLVSGGLELVLPDAFVAAASWPITLDPLIGPEFQVSFPPVGPLPLIINYDRQPAVAFDSSTNNHLVVWERAFAFGDLVVHGQLFDEFGGLVGNAFALTGTTPSHTARVASVNGANRFAVTWLQDFFGQTQVRLRAVDAANGSLSSNVEFLGSEPVGALVTHDLAGEARVGAGISPRAFSVWSDPVEGVRCSRVSVPAGTGDVNLVQTFTIEADPGLFETVSRPVISKATSTNGRLGVAWERRNSLAGTTRVYATVIDRNGSVLHTPVLVSGSDGNVSNVAIDGGGEPARYVVAWGNDPTPSTIAFDSALRTTTLVSTNTLTAGNVNTLLFGQSQAPFLSLGWRPGLATLAYTVEGSVLSLGVDPLTGRSATQADSVAPELVLPNGNIELNVAPRICMQASGGNDQDALGVFVWTRQLITSSSGFVADEHTEARLLTAFDSQATAVNIGGGCGNVGTIVAPQPPAIGNGTFAIQLQSPGPGLIGILNIAAPQPLLSCGACDFVPPATTYIVPLNPLGVEQKLPVPAVAALAGAQAYVQWLVFAPGVAPCGPFPDFGASDILVLTVN